MPKLWACYEPDLIQYHKDRAAAQAVKSEEVSAMLKISMGGLEEEKILSIDGGIAQIRIEGVLTQAGPDLFDLLFGVSGTGYGDIIDAIAEAEADPDVESIELLMDTPGGEVSGVDGVYQAVAEVEKPITAHNMGMIASAGYWIASAADKIVAESAIVETGSIGVIVSGYDATEALEREGIKRVDVVSDNAPNKAPRLSSEEGIEEIKSRINALERVFISRVATGRAVSEDHVRANFGQGSVLIASDPGSENPDALSVGMIDEIFYTPADSGSGSNGLSALESTPQASAEISKGDEMNAEEIQAALAELEQLKADHAELKVRVERAMPYLIGTDYPAAIRTLAVQVLDGKAEPAELKGAIVALDALREETITNAAVVDTNEAPEVNTQPIDAPVASEDGQIRNEIDFQATVARLKSQRNIVR